MVVYTALQSYGMGRFKRAVIFFIFLFTVFYNTIFVLRFTFSHLSLYYAT